MKNSTLNPRLSADWVCTIQIIYMFWFSHRCSWNQGSVTACSGSAPVHRRSVAGGWTARSAVLPEYPKPERRPLSECPHSCKKTHNASMCIFCWVNWFTVALIYFLFIFSAVMYIWQGRIQDKKRICEGGRIAGVSVMVRVMPLNVHTVYTYCGITFASSAELMLLSTISERSKLFLHCLSSHHLPFSFLHPSHSPALRTALPTWYSVLNMVNSFPGIISFLL